MTSAGLYRVGYISNSATRLAGSQVAEFEMYPDPETMLSATPT